MLNCLGIIPARKGSKGIIKKNLRELAGLPLVQYTINAAKSSKLLSKIVLSTDSEDIAKIGKEMDIEVPFLRPSDLAEDDTPMLDVISHCIDYLVQNQNYNPEIIVLLQPTSPLRNSNHIDESIELLISKKADSVVSVCLVPGQYNPDWQLKISDNYLQTITDKDVGSLITRRQDLNKTFYRNGAIYAFTYRSFKKFGNIYGQKCVPYIMDRNNSCNIDDSEDWFIAESRIKQTNINNATS